MNKLISLTRAIFVYCLQVFIVSLAGALPPTLYFFVIFLISPNGNASSILGATLFIGLMSLITIVFPFCLLVATPLAILVNHFTKLTLPKVITLAIVLTVPAIIFLDYRTYLSNGPDSGPPTDPYSVTHLWVSLNSGTDFFLMIIIPTASALLCAATLWYLRFREPSNY